MKVDAPSSKAGTCPLGFIEKYSAVLRSPFTVSISICSTSSLRKKERNFTLHAFPDKSLVYSSILIVGLWGEHRPKFNYLSTRVRKQDCWATSARCDRSIGRSTRRKLALRNDNCASDPNLCLQIVQYVHTYNATQF